MWQMIAPQCLVRGNVIVVFCTAMAVTTPYGVAAPRITAGLKTHPPIIRVADEARSRDFDEAQRLLLSNGVGAASKAVVLLRSAAEQGNALAEYDLGYCYEAGIGVPADAVQALAWYRRVVADTLSSDLLSIAISSMQNLDAQSPAVTSQPAPAPQPIAPPAEPAVEMNAPAAPPPPAPPASPPSDASLPPNVVASLISRGNDMLRAGNVSAARLFFTRAAAAGNSEAAMTVGETYDQRFLAQIGAKGLVADRVAAELWYRRAAALGNRDADLLLAGLDEKPVVPR